MLAVRTLARLSLRTLARLALRTPNIGIDHRLRIRIQHLRCRLSLQTLLPRRIVPALLMLMALLPLLARLPWLSAGIALLTPLRSGLALLPPILVTAAIVLPTGRALLPGRPALRLQPG